MDSKPPLLQDDIARLEAEVALQDQHYTEANQFFIEANSSYTLRRRKFRDLRHAVAENLNRRFSLYMSRRGHTGQVNVNWKEQQLSISVGVNKARATTDLKALSGGERSVTTIAFVLALGHEGISPPFHALDEFDVFTDAINRRYR